MKYQKKQIQIEAIQFTRNNWTEILAFTNNTAHTLRIEKRINGECTCIIPTLEGEHIASENDYIIKGVEGEFYPCKPDIFAKTYSEVSKNSENNISPNSRSITAVEWLVNEIDMQYPEINVRCKEWMIDKAKQMDKEQQDLLLECRLQLEYLNEKFGETGTTNALLAKLNNN